MDQPLNKSGLLVEDKIELLNRLSSYYKMSEFFFSLDRDTVRTANDHDITVVKLKSEPSPISADKISADKIKEICERLKLLDVVSTDDGNVIKKKNILRRKLLQLTRNLSEIQ